MLSEEQTFVTLDYSINGGIEWTTLEIIPLDGVSTQQLYQVVRKKILPTIFIVSLLSL